MKLTPLVKALIAAGLTATDAERRGTIMSWRTCYWYVRRHQKVSA